MSKGSLGATTMRGTTTKYKYLVLFFVLVVADQLSKFLVDKFFTETTRKTCIDGFLFLSKHYNRGAAFSFLAELDWGIYLLAFLSIVAGIMFLVAMFKARSALGSYIFSMLAAGTLGNGIDRVFRGFVIDFIEAHFGNYVFPSFNFADSYLTVHIILLVILMIFAKYDPYEDLSLNLTNKTEE